MQTLLNYHMPAGYQAFSTTRMSPFDLSDGDLRRMGNYAAFNVTDYCGDDPLRVQRNRHWLAGQIGIPSDRIILPRQTHTDHVAYIGAEFLKMPPADQRTHIEETDALITALPNICIGVSTADCVPILLYSTGKRAIAAIHAGWRGTVKRIVQRTVQTIQQLLEVPPQDLHAIIGPSISVSAFEVGQEVADQFEAQNFPSTCIDRASYAKPHIDLWVANAWLLEECGVPLPHIEISGICTYTHADTFFSARRLGIDSGRIFSAILMREP